MHASITDNLELVLIWNTGGESTVSFKLASSSEFTINGRICWSPSLNYQGETEICFRTMCYGYDLDQFAFELSRMAQGKTESAQFLNTVGDFEIRAIPQDSASKRVLLSELRYRRNCRIGKDVSRNCELVLPVGEVKNLWQTAQTIDEAIRLLKVDCRNAFELPQ